MAGLTSSHILDAKYLLQRQRGQVKDDLAGRYTRQTKSVFGNSTTASNSKALS